MKARLAAAGLRHGAARPGSPAPPDPDGGEHASARVAEARSRARERGDPLVGLIDGVDVVGTACDGAEAVRLAEDHRPDVVLMDLRMPGTDGIAATADLRQRLPATRVLVLTTLPGRLQPSGQEAWAELLMRAAPTRAGDQFAGQLLAVIKR